MKAEEAERIADQEVAARDRVLLEADAILIDAGVNPRDLWRFSWLKGRILRLVDGDSAMTYEECLHQAAENLADHGGTIGEHTALLCSDFGIAPEEAERDLIDVLLGRKVERRLGLTGGGR